MLPDNPYDQDDTEWQQMVDVDINSVLTGINIVLHDMVECQEATIINISSITGRKTFPGHFGYCGTKFSVHAITENIREEVASENIRLMTISQGKRPY